MADRVEKSRECADVSRESFGAYLLLQIVLYIGPQRSAVMRLHIVSRQQTAV
jgi:hypothetical protein